VLAEFSGQRVNTVGEPVRGVDEDKQLGVCAAGLGKSAGETHLAGPQRYQAGRGLVLSDGERAAPQCRSGRGEQPGELRRRISGWADVAQRKAICTGGHF
jgi:hypothetical protein